MAASPALEPLDRLVGTWTTEATHPAMPGVLVHGITEVEWLEGERFLIHRAHSDHPDFPDFVAVTGITDRDRAGGGDRDESALTMHYFDSRGVFRVLEVEVDDEWRMSRMAPGFSQRFVGTFADDGGTINGRWQLCEDDVTWNDDLEITYRRR